MLSVLNKQLSNKEKHIVEPKLISKAYLVQGILDRYCRDIKRFLFVFSYVKQIGK